MISYTLKKNTEEVWRNDSFADLLITVCTVNTLDWRLDDSQLLQCVNYPRLKNSVRLAVLSCFFVLFFCGGVFVVNMHLLAVIVCLSSFLFLNASVLLLYDHLFVAVVSFLDVLCLCGDVVLPRSFASFAVSPSSFQQDILTITLCSL